MPKAPRRITHVPALPGYRLAVQFVDGPAAEVDLSRLVTSEHAGVFSKRRDPALFADVCLDYGAVIWPGEVGLAPDTMYDAMRVHGCWVLE